MIVCEGCPEKGSNLNPELDRKAKIQELRSLYDKVNSRKGNESSEDTGECIDE